MTANHPSCITSTTIIRANTKQTPALTPCRIRKTNVKKNNYPGTRVVIPYFDYMRFRFQLNLLENIYNLFDDKAKVKNSHVNSYEAEGRTYLLTLKYKF